MWVEAEPQKKLSRWLAEQNAHRAHTFKQIEWMLEY